MKLVKNTSFVMTLRVTSANKLPIFRKKHPAMSKLIVLVNISNECGRELSIYTNSIGKWSRRMLQLRHFNQRPSAKKMFFIPFFKYFIEKINLEQFVL